MNVQKRVLRNLFDGNNRYEAPLFQRSYVWQEEKNWKPLWEAIQLVARKKLDHQNVRPHFLGAIVLDQLPTHTGDVPSRQIIDGQQRLTTLQLALAALRDYCMENEVQDYGRDIDRLTTNTVYISQNKDERFKVWPTNSDQQDFRDVMTAGSREMVSRLPHADPEDDWLIPDAYLYFHAEFSRWIETDVPTEREERILALRFALADGLQMVVIDLDESDDAQEIFETLNALGSPLTASDLVKNFIFHEALERNRDVAYLHERFWKEFDLEKGYWRQNVKQGRLKRPRMDMFLFHYLTLMTADSLLDTQMFDRFKLFYTNEFHSDPERHLESLHRYAKTYTTFDSDVLPQPERVFFRRLRELDITTVFPLLLEVYNRYPSGKEGGIRKSVLRDIESYLIRRRVCGLTSQNYNRFFTDMIRFCKKKKDFSPATIQSVLLDSDSDASRWPDDEEFREKWMETPFSKKISKGHQRIILEALEDASRSTKAEEMEITEKLTIEHLMPREWERHWPLRPSRSDSRSTKEQFRAREEYTQRIGNLTLLSKALNPAISNGPWEKKSVAIQKHSLLALNKYFATVTTWNEAQIDRRSKSLFTLAKRIWPHP